MLVKNYLLAIGTLLGLSLTGCGQDPAFQELEKSNRSKSVADSVRKPNSEDGTASSDEDLESEDGGILGDMIGKPRDLADKGDGKSSDGSRNDQGNPDNGDANDDDQSNDEDIADEDNPSNPDIEFPDINDQEDIDALHKCLAKWNQHPFRNQANVRTINANIVVGGSGIAINDKTRTSEPQLMLIKASVNVLSKPTFNFLNPNGYYCMKVNVNVLSDVTINLHCNARLADSKVSINIGSVMSDDTAAIGVHVGSKVSVNTFRPSGDECIR